LRVISTNQTASKTVTAWENTSHKRFMLRRFHHPHHQARGCV
jgi:hypothetical protein